MAIENRPALQTALESVKGYLGIEATWFDQRQYLGTTIYTVKNQAPDANAPPRPWSFSYALTDSYLFVVFGSPKVLEKALAQAARPEPSLWDQKAIQSALRTSAFRPNEVAVSYSRLGPLLYDAFTTLNYIQSLARNNEETAMLLCEPGLWLNPDSLPFFTIGKMYVEEAGLFTQHLLLKRPDA